MSYLSLVVKKFIDNLIDMGELTNIILYSENTSGKTQTAHYIAEQYYKKLFESHKINIKDFKTFESFENESEEKIKDTKIDITKKISSLKISEFYLYQSLSLVTPTNLTLNINDYISNKSKDTFFKIYGIKNMKKIIIIDDLYFVNKLIIDTLLKIFSSYDDSKVIFILIIKDLSDIHEMIKARCLTFNIKEFEVTSDYLHTKYKELTDETIKYIVKNFTFYSTNTNGNSICMVDKFLYYVTKYNDGDINTCILNMLKNDIVLKGKQSLINEIFTLFTSETLGFEEKMERMIKILRIIYKSDIYPENILNVILNYSIKSDILDNIKVIIIEECVKTLYKIYKYSDSNLQLNKCFIKIVEKINLLEK